MALLYMDGFDFPNETELSEDNFRAKGWTVVGSPDSGLSANVGRFGSGRTIDWSDADAYIYKDITVTGDNTVIVGIAFFPAAIDSTPDELGDVLFQLIDFGGDGDMITASWGAQTTNHRLDIRRGGIAGTILGNTGNTIIANAWNYIEVKIVFSDSVGTVDVKVNEVSQLSLTSQDTMIGTSTTVNQILLGAGGSTLNQTDDLYILDGTGSVNNDFLGEVRVATIIPESETTQTDWAPFSGTDNALMVDDFTDEATYVEASVSGNKDLYNMTGVGGATAIAGIQHTFRAQKTDLNAISVRGVILDQATTSNGASNALGTTLASYETILENRPQTGTPWTESTIDIIQAGIEVL